MVPALPAKPGLPPDGQGIHGLNKSRWRTARCSSTCLKLGLAESVFDIAKLRTYLEREGQSPNERLPWTSDSRSWEVPRLSPPKMIASILEVGRLPARRAFPNLCSRENHAKTSGPDQGSGGFSRRPKSTGERRRRIVDFWGPSVRGCFSHWITRSSFVFGSDRFGRVRPYRVQTCGFSVLRPVSRRFFAESMPYFQVGDPEFFREGVRKTGPDVFYEIALKKFRGGNRPRSFFRRRLFGKTISCRTPRWE